MPKLSPLMQLIRSRRSTRAFADIPVPRQLIKQCAEAARFAPSACNVQPWRFLVIDEPRLKETFVKRAFSGVFSPMRHLGEAPVLVVMLARLDIKANRLGAQVQGTNYYLIDLGIAGEHFVLRAHEFGLGTCWIGWFSSRGVRRVLKIPRAYRVVSLLALGYPSRGKGRRRGRKALKEILSFNRVGK